MAPTVTGGSFLISTCGSVSQFIPENFDEQQKELANTTSQFSEREVLSLSDKIEAKEAGVIANTLKKAGELGLLMAEVPEEFGGLGLNKVSSALIAENMTYQGSFSVAFTCHTGIGTLPLLYYGTREQKEKYLPKLASGEMIGAYSLTEPESGSDALSVHTRAVLSPDKKYYILNGEKIYCTNGGIADLTTVFAKIDGDKFSAFLVEKGAQGFEVGPEEEKMGIHGSSTTSLFFNDAKIPVENVLGEIGRGHKIAFNTLNIGRFKLGAACMGSCKRMIEIVCPQANTRHQFGKSIGSFELIRQKIARMVCRTYLLESLVYRYAGDLDTSIATLDKKAPDYFDKLHDAIEEFSVEAAIAKVYGSETLDFVADESVQIFGGAGFIKGYAAEREYRDSRVNRIFEGTNEICRLIIPATLIKRAMAGKLPMMQKLGEILSTLKTGFPVPDQNNKKEVLTNAVEEIKRLAIYLTGVAVQKLADNLKDRQSVLETIADVITEAYAFDAGLARAMATGDANSYDICHGAIAERTPYLVARARQALVNIAGGNSAECTSYFKALSRLVSPLVVDTDKIYDEIAKRTLEKEKYG